MGVTGSTSLPLADEGLKWDGARTAKRVRDFYTDDDGATAWKSVHAAFFYVVDGEEETLSGHKLGFADVVDDRLTAVPAGLKAVAGVLMGARGGVKGISDADKERIKSKVAAYYKRMDLSPPWADEDRGAAPDAIVQAAGGQRLVSDPPAGPAAPGSRRATPAGAADRKPDARREATTTPATFDAADNSLEVCFSTGAPVRRFDYDRRIEFIEVLDLDGMDLSNLNRGAHVLKSHGYEGFGLGSVIGCTIPDSARIVDVAGGQEARARIRLSSEPDDAAIVRKIRDGIICKLSFGYDYVGEPEISTDAETGLEVRLWRMTRPIELSFVALEADNGTGTRAARQGVQDMEPKKTTATDPNPSAAAVTPAPEALAAANADGRKAEAERRKEIRAIGTRLHVPDAEIRKLEDDPAVSVDAARNAFFESVAARADAVATTPHVEVGRTERETRAAALTAGIEAHVVGTDPPDIAKEFRAHTLLDFARESLEASGVKTRGMFPVEIARKAMALRSLSTSDFPILLEAAANKVLRAAYKPAELSFPAWGTRNDFVNLMARKNVALGEAASLLPVVEGEEYEESSLSEGSESAQAFKYGRIIGVTLELIVNDDLRAFARIPGLFAGSAMRKQEAFVYALLSTPQTMGDTKPLFHVDHNNIATLAGAPTAARLDEMDKLMSMQKGLDAVELVGVPMRTVIAPRALKQTLEALLGDKYVPNTAANAITSDMAQLKRVYSPFLDGSSTTAYFGAADPGSMDGLEYGYLKGEGGPVIEREEGFGNDTLRYKCRLFFGAHINDWRAFVKNAGA